MYGELRCLKKPFTKFKTFPNVQKWLPQFCRKLCKNGFYNARSFERNRASVEGFFRSIEQESSINQLGKSFGSFFLINSIDQTKVSTDRTTWNLNIHKENSRSQNSILFTLQMNTLQPFIIIITYPCIYLYIRHQPHENTSEHWTIEVVCNSFSTLRLILDHIIQMWKVIRVTFLHDH